MACSLWILSAAGRTPVACVLRPIKAPSPSGRVGVGVLGAERAERPAPMPALPTSYTPPPTNPSSPATHHVPSQTTPLRPAATSPVGGGRNHRTARDLGLVVCGWPVDGHPALGVTRCMARVLTGGCGSARRFCSVSGAVRQEERVRERRVGESPARGALRSRTGVHAAADHRPLFRHPQQGVKRQDRGSCKGCGLRTNRRRLRRPRF